MKWLSNFTLFMRSNVTALRESFENPQRMVHQLIIDMEEELVRIRAGVAGAIADEILLRKRTEAAREESRQWMDRATQSLKRGDDAGAKAALEHKMLAEKRAQSLEEEHRKQKEQTAKLQGAVTDLDDKIRQARQKQTLLLARLTRAESSRRIDAALHQAAGQSAFAQFARLEDRVNRAEAMDEAYDRLDGRDPDADALARQFEERERKDQLERELAELKNRVAPQD